MKISNPNEYINQSITTQQKCLTILRFPITLSLVLDWFTKLCSWSVSPLCSLIPLEGGGGIPSKWTLPGLEGDEEPEETANSVPLLQKSCLLWPEEWKELHWPESIKNGRWSVLAARSDNWSCWHGHINSLSLKVGWFFHLMWLICCLFNHPCLWGFHNYNCLWLQLSVYIHFFA